MNMRKRTLVGLSILVAVAVFVGILLLSPKAPTLTNLNIRGGPSFFGTANTQMAEFNKSIGREMTIVDERNTCGEKGEWENVDLIQAGTLNCQTELKKLFAENPKFAEQGYKFYSESILTTSPYVLVVKANPDQNDFDPLMAANYIYTSGNTFLIDPEDMTKLVIADVEGKKFNDPSVGVNIDQNVTIGFPNSTVGVPSADLLLSYAFNGGQEMIGTDATMKTTDAKGNEVATLKPEYANALIALYERSGKVVNGSLDYCHNWLNAKTDPVRISIFSESCYTSWAIKYADKPELMKSKGNVLVYMTKTAKSTFTLIAVSQAGQDYLDAIKDSDQFYQIAAETTGMRASGIVDIAPTQWDEHIPANEPWSLLGFPQDIVSAATKYVLDNYGK